ncbi:MAG: hypothetical protein LLF96_09200 [Eubacteriales bacterium]|nr:hypothetical protein [Eubacteriales bacterium]
MIVIWDAIEADFRRDYGIILRDSITVMSWREFLVLLTNLNPRGAVSVRVQTEKDEIGNDPVEDEAAASSFFAGIAAIRG